MIGGTLGCVELGHDVDTELRAVEEEFAVWGKWYYSKERQAYLAYGFLSDYCMFFWSHEVGR